MTYDNRSTYDRLVRRFKDNKVTAVLALLPVVITGLAASVTGFGDILDFLSRHFASNRVTLDQVAINASESYFERAPSVDLASSCCVRDPELSTLHIGVYDLVQWKLSETGYRLFRLYTEIYQTQEDYSTLLVAAQQASWPSAVANDLAHLESRPRADILDASLWQRILPVLDVTLNNSSATDVLLVGVELEGQLFDSHGGDAGDGQFPVRPLAVSHKYVVDLARFNSDEAGEKLRAAFEAQPTASPDGYSRLEQDQANIIEKMEQELLPPLPIPKEKRVRFQIQFFDSNGELGTTWRDYVIRVKFHISGGNKVMTNYFVISFPSG